jgi:hypothetical protein
MRAGGVRTAEGREGEMIGALSVVVADRSVRERVTVADASSPRWCTRKWRLRTPVCRRRPRTAGAIDSRHARSHARDTDRQAPDASSGREATVPPTRSSRRHENLLLPGACKPAAACVGSAMRPIWQEELASARAELVTARNATSCADGTIGTRCTWRAAGFACTSRMAQVGSNVAGCRRGALSAHDDPAITIRQSAHQSFPMSVWASESWGTKAIGHRCRTGVHHTP